MRFCIDSMELAKSFEPHEIERRWYPIWESRGYFAASLDPRSPRLLHPAAAAQRHRARCTWGTRSSRR